MTISLKHNFQSAKPDGTDTSIVRPSNWNDEHVLTLAAGNVLGRAAGTAGAAQELPLSVGTDGTVIVSANTTTTALRVTQTGTGNAFVVEDSANPDSTPFQIDASGNVAIGTTTADALLTVAGVSAFGAGAVGAPSIARSGDLDTGMWFPAANTVAISTAATERVRIDGTGVGIGSAPTTTLDVAGTIRTGSAGSDPGTGSALYFVGSGNFQTVLAGAALAVHTGANSARTEKLRVDADGNVGIGGTANAYNKLYITGTLPSGSTVARGVEVSATVPSGATAQGLGFISALSTQATAFTLTNLQHYVATQGTIGVGSTVTTQIGYEANSSLTGAANNYGFYSAIPAGTGRWNFFANGTADNYFAGRIAVGNTAPGAPIDATAQSDALAIRLRGRSSDGISDLQFTDNAASTAYAILRVIPSNTLAIYTGASERMRIDSSGNVGIGTSSPGSKLNVYGASGTVTARVQSGSGYIDLSHIGTDAYLTNSTGPFQIWTAGSERMRVHASGGVSIGDTTDPGDKTLRVAQQIVGGYNALGTANTAAQALATYRVSKVTISANTTLTTTVPAAGATARVIIVSSGTVSRTVTFGTGFLSTGTLATGAVDAKTFVVSFVSDGTNLIETGRTTAM